MCKGRLPRKIVKKAIQHLKKADPVLAAIIERVGPYKITYREPVFQTLVRSIVYQQLNGKAALKIYSRLAEAAKADPLTPNPFSSCARSACAPWDCRRRSLPISASSRASPNLEM